MQESFLLGSHLDAFSRDPSLYWGTWYTLSTCTTCGNPSNVCSQVTYQANDPSSLSTNLTYIGSYNVEQPSGANKQAFGTMINANPETFDPLYRLTINFDFGSISSDFWVITTAGDGKEISAIVTMSCNTTGSDMLLFYLSRKPYFVAPVTFDLLESQVKRAINNYDEFTMNSIIHAQGKELYTTIVMSLHVIVLLTFMCHRPIMLYQYECACHSAGWCDYQYSNDFEPAAVATVECPETDNTSADFAKGASIAASVFTAIILVLLTYATFFRRK
jgi:hypothetical protein